MNWILGPCPPHYLCLCSAAFIKIPFNLDVESPRISTNHSKIAFRIWSPASFFLGGAVQPSCWSLCAVKSDQILPLRNASLGNVVKRAKKGVRYKEIVRIAHWPDKGSFIDRNVVRPIRFSPFIFMTTHRRRWWWWDGVVDRPSRATVNWIYRSSSSHRKRPRKLVLRRATPFLIPHRLSPAKSITPNPNLLSCLKFGRSSCFVSFPYATYFSSGITHVHR